MESFPLTIGDQLFSNQTLAGKRYVQNYPDLLEAVVRQASYVHSRASTDVYTGFFVLERRFYQRQGSFTFNCTPEKLFFPGQFLIAYSEILPGGLGVAEAWFIGVVQSYNRRTGELTVYIDGFSPKSMREGKTFISAHIQHAHVSQANPVSVAQGGTGTNSITTAVSNLNLPIPATMAEEIFDDFVEELNPLGDMYAYPYRVLSAVGSASYSQAPGIDVNFSQRAGFLNLACSGATDVITLARGLGAFHVAGGTFSFRTAVYIPTLSNGVDRFKLHIGLKGANSSSTDIFSYSGLGFTYTDTENAARWVIRYGTNGAMTTNNTATTVTAGAWHSLIIEFNGTNILFYINAVLALTIGAASGPQSGALNLIAPAVQLAKSVGGSTRNVVVDYFFRQKRVTR